MPQLSPGDVFNTGSDPFLYGPGGGGQFTPNSWGPGGALNFDPSSGWGFSGTAGSGAQTPSLGATDASGNPVALGPAGTGTGSGDSVGGTSPQGGFNLASALPLAGLGGVAAAGIGLLGMNDQAPQSLGQMQGLANYDVSQGQQLQSYLSSGTLPANLQAKLDLAEKAGEASRLQAAATMGGPADPTRNTAVAQDLSSLKMQEAAAAGQLETELYAAGTKELGDAGNLLNQITGYDIKLQQQQTAALTGFAQALASLFAPSMKSLFPTMGGAATGGASAAAGGTAMSSIGGEAAALGAIV